MKGNINHKLNMKRIITILILIGLTNLITAQNIVDTTKMWRNRIIGFECNSNSYLERYTETIIFEGDTTIDFKQYKKILRATDEFYSQWEFYAFIREDVNEKVFIRTDTSLQEYLLYDFNPAINDTFTVYSLFDYTYLNAEYGIVSNVMKVDSIDTIFIAGKNRKRISIGCDNCMEEYWVEGIGNLENGILHNQMGYFNSITQNLLCVYNSDTLLYVNPEINSCYEYYECPTNIVEENETKKITIYPNPVTETSTLKINTSLYNNTLEMYNNQGKLLKIIEMDNEYVINRKDFKSGIYFYLIRNKEDLLGKGKFIIK